MHIIIINYLIKIWVRSTAAQWLKQSRQTRNNLICQCQQSNQSRQRLKMPKQRRKWKSPSKSFVWRLQNQTKTLRKTWTCTRVLANAAQTTSLLTPKIQMPSSGIPHSNRQGTKSSPTLESRAATQVKWMNLNGVKARRITTRLSLVI